MTAPDSLEDALLQVPWVHAAICNPLAHRNYMGDGAWCIPVPDGPALAVAAREWARERMPTARSEVDAYDGRPTFSPFARAYNLALAAVAKALGLEERS